MIKNYIKIAWRNLWNNKVYSILNIFGLAIGLCCFLLIVLYVTDELGYDRFYPNADRIYRVNADINTADSYLHSSQTSDMMGELLQKDYPQVKNYTRFYTSDGDKFIKKGSVYVVENRTAHVDSTFFEVFQRPAIEGNLKTALTHPNSVVITASTAKKYFGTTNALHQTLATKKNGEITLYKVKAIIPDFPKNSHFQFDLLFSMKNIDYEWQQILSHNFYTYLLLEKEVNDQQFEKDVFPTYIKNYILPEVSRYMQINSLDEFENAGYKIAYHLMPLKRIHLYSDFSFELGPSGNIQYVYIFSAVALFILLIACINFMNLTTARSTKRAKEVGIRKVLGSKKKELIVQFLFESTILVTIALCIAILLVYLSLPVFNGLADKQILLTRLFSPFILPVLLLTPIVIGLFSGSYPAFFLSAFLPAQVLKGRVSDKDKTKNLRSGLVIFQFTTSIALIIGTIVVYRQLHYIQTSDIGFNKEQVLIVNNTSVLHHSIKTFKNEVLEIPGVSSGTISSFLPVSSSRSDNLFSKEASIHANNSFDLQTWFVDEDYLPTYEIKLQQGRNFSSNYGNDTSAVIINETAAVVLGYDNPIGKKIFRFTGDPNASIAYTIIGVIKDFNYETLHNKINPLALFLGESNHNVSFKIHATDINDLIPKIEDKWKSIVPGTSFSYRFLDESYQKMYNSERRVGKIAIVFSGIAIFIACMGLFGLAAFIAEQRRKEIGIRKVLGASVQNIVRLLSQDFIKLVLISVAFASPIAWWSMTKWLQSFTFRIDIHWWLFILAGGAAIAIALITISFQAIKAAITNPVKSLKI